MAIEDIPHYFGLPLTSGGTVMFQTVQQQPTGGGPADPGFHADAQIYAAKSYSHIQVMPVHTFAFDPAAVAVAPAAVLTVAISSKLHRRKR